MSIYVLLLYVNRRVLIAGLFFGPDQPRSIVDSIFSGLFWDEYEDCDYLVRQTALINRMHHRHFFQRVEIQRLTIGQLSETCNTLLHEEELKTGFHKLIAANP